MSISTTHLTSVHSHSDYAAGKVDCSYPCPVVANTIQELALFEASDHGATCVSISLDNKFNSGYMGKNMTYVPASIGSITENDFNTCRGKMNESYLDGEISFRATKRCLYDEIYRRTSDSVTNLLFKLAADQVKGTILVVFKSYPNGTKCWAEEHAVFRICL